MKKCSKVLLTLLLTTGILFALTSSILAESELTSKEGNDVSVGINEVFISGNDLVIQGWGYSLQHDENKSENEYRDGSTRNHSYQLRVNGQRVYNDTGGYYVSHTNLNHYATTGAWQYYNGVGFEFKIPLNDYVPQAGQSIKLTFELIMHHRGRTDTVVVHYASPSSETVTHGTWEATVNPGSKGTVMRATVTALLIAKQFGVKGSWEHFENCDSLSNGTTVYLDYHHDSDFPIVDDRFDSTNKVRWYKTNFYFPRYGYKDDDVSYGDWRWRYYVVSPNHNQNRLNQEYHNSATRYSNTLYQGWVPDNFINYSRSNPLSVIITNKKVDYNNTSQLYAWGFVGGEGDSGSSNNALWLGSKTTQGTLGNSWILDTSKAYKNGAVPKGFALSKNVGTYYTSPGGAKNSWHSETLGARYTQPAHEMSFEFDASPIDYKITYNGIPAGITNSNPSSYNVLYGVTLKNPSNRTGYNFNGWYSGKSKVTGINQGANARFTSPDDMYNKLASRTVGNVTFEAKWSPWKHTINYNANGGTNAPSAQIKTYGQKMYLSSQVPTRTGYTFVEWNTRSDGNGQSFNPGQEWTQDNNGGSTTLYAKWNKNSYSNSTALWATGFKNGEGNNGSKNAFNIGSGKINAYYQDSFTITTNSVPRNSTVPNGFTLSTNFGTPNESPSGANGGGWKSYPFGTRYTQPAGEMYFEFYASPISYGIKYTGVPNGITNSNPTSYNVLYGVTLKNPSNRTGYTFNGWTNGNSKITGINTGANANFANADDMYNKLAGRETGNKTLTAQWTANQYNITYYGNGGSPNNINDKATFDTTYTVKASTVVSRYGYNFTKWNTQANGQGATYNPGQQFKWVSVNPLNLYAIWSPWRHTVNFNANGGNTNSIPNSFTKIYDTKAYIPNTIPTRTGYTFDGWTTNADGTGTKYSPGQELPYAFNKDGGTLTLYAKWKINVYSNTINFVAKGFENGEGNHSGYTSEFIIGSTNFNKNYGDKFAINIKDAAKGGQLPNGYEWSNLAIGSNYNVDGSNAGSWKWYNINTQFTQSTNNMLFGLYCNPTTYTITYKGVPNGITNSNPTTYNVLYGVKFVTPSNRTGYTFNGWNINNKKVTGINEGQNARFTNTDDLYNKLASRFTGNVVVEAKWTANQYDVNYFGNGGNPSKVVDKATYDTTYTVKSSSAVSRHGYNFISWNTQADGRGTAYNAGQQIPWKSTSPLNLYAQWKPWEHNIIFNPNGGSGGPNPQTKIFNNPLQLSSLVPIKGDSKFVSWNTKPDGSGTNYYPGQDWTIDGNGNSTTLYAQWKNVDRKPSLQAEEHYFIQNQNVSIQNLKDTIHAYDEVDTDIQNRLIVEKILYIGTGVTIDNPTMFDTSVDQIVKVYYSVTNSAGFTTKLVVEYPIVPLGGAAVPNPELNILYPRFIEASKIGTINSNSVWSDNTGNAHKEDYAKVLQRVLNGDYSDYEQTKVHFDNR